MAKHGKKYLDAAKLIDGNKQYTPEEAIALIKKGNYVKFDSSIEASFSLNVDPRHAEQQIRGAMVLPNGTGKTRKVLVITQGAKEEEAKAAGADFVGGKDMLDQIKKGWLEFDIIVATPDMMGELGKLGKILGPKGLMPNPKTGTVTMDLTKAIGEIKKGKVEYRVDKEGNLACMIGKMSFTDKALAENYKALYDQLQKSKPSTVKGNFMKNAVLCSTMGPGVKVNHD